MPGFEPFPAVRYQAAIDGLDPLIAPPYDVLSEDDISQLAGRDPHNIVHIDVPRENDGPGRYELAARTLNEWLSTGILVKETEPSFTIYRMAFVDASGAQREISGVLGGLEVVDAGAGGVLPHERTTPKASTDRLDLTRATKANLSPVWGLSLSKGLTAELAAPEEVVGRVVVDEVQHQVERVTNPNRIERIRKIVAGDDVLIADGHHRYSISRTYRDEIRTVNDGSAGAGEQTLTFVSELVADQLSVEAIHRVYRGSSIDALRSQLNKFFHSSPAEQPTPATLREMVERGALYLLWRDAAGNHGEWLDPRPEAFTEIRNLDGACLEHALSDLEIEVSYQHGLKEVIQTTAAPGVTAAILIRPVSVAEIERTARQGVLMPPKSTFFSPKLRTGLVIRPLWD